VNKWIKITLWSIVAIAVVVGVVFAQKAINNMTLLAPTIEISVDGENAILNKEEVMTRLQRQNLIYVNQRVKDLNTERIERFISNMEEVKNVKIYSSFGGKWTISIVLRKPLFHVYNPSGENYYVDTEGYKISSTIDHAARVLIITADKPLKFNQKTVFEIINNDSLKTIQKIDNVYRISNYVCNDPLMRSLIGQIHLKNNGDFVLIPVVGDQTIVFGMANTEKEIENKFEKLKIFYKEAIPYEGWSTYSEISLKYDKQIVCKKKE